MRERVTNLWIVVGLLGFVAFGSWGYWWALTNSRKVLEKGSAWDKFKQEEVTGLEMMRIVWAYRIVAGLSGVGAVLSAVWILVAVLQSAPSP